MGLKSFYFQIGGLRVPNRNITCQEMSNVAGSYSYGKTSNGAAIPIEESEADSYVILTLGVNTRSDSFGRHFFVSQPIKNIFIRGESPDKGASTEL